mgnify:CR=1 FL=1
MLGEKVRPNGKLFGSRGKSGARTTERSVMFMATPFYRSSPAFRSLAREFGLKDGDVFMLLRVAVSGRTATPGIFETLAAIGRERCLERVERAKEVVG